MMVIGLIFVVARYFRLLETPTGENSILGFEITTQGDMAESNTSSERMDDVAVFLSADYIIYYLNPPMVVAVPDGLVPITAHFVLVFRYGRWH